MNVSELSNALHAKINSATNLDQILLLSKAVERLKLGNVNIVTNFSDLASVKFEPSSNYGSLYFVTSQNELYIFAGPGIWASILKGAKILSYGWGINTNGRLGDGTTTSRLSPVSVVGGFTDWTQVSTRDDHSLGVRANGTAWGWGINTNGRLGDETVTQRLSPVSVVGGFTDWIQVSAGQAHSLGVRENGTAWAWGFNGNGRLGDNTTVAKSSPVSVVGGFTDWIQVSAGQAHSLGVRENGTAWAWGSNASGRLGDGTTVAKSSPVSVVGGFTDWVQLAAGEGHSLGLRADGTAWAWGLNGNGRLGDNTTVTKNSPVSVVGGFTDWIQVATGQDHSLGVRANGTAWAWGVGSTGKLGDNSTVAKSSPVSVVGGFTDWIQVSAGQSHGLGVRANGTAWAWGSNANGRLGDNTTVQKISPVSVVGGFTDWIQVSGSLAHSLALRSS